MRKHPDLGKKLLTLYRKRLNPNVISNVELAKKLGVSKQAVSRWCRGTQTQEGDSIPNQQIIPISDVFGIEPLWFTLDYPEFELAVDSRVSANRSQKMDSRELVSISMLPNTGLDIVGRDDEIMQLNDYWQSNTTNVVQIVAFGGVGKSSLVNKWLSELSKERYRYASRIYAWSFHWQGEKSDVQASGDFFIEHALQWFGDANPESGTPWSKAIRLARLIRKYRALIILDGIECVLYPPGENEGAIECPAIEIFLKELASNLDGLCVLTSRLPVSDLNTFKDGRVVEINLQNLSSEAGALLLSKQGVRGDVNMRYQAVAFYKGHALSLTLLAGYLSVVHQGDVSHFRELESLLEEKRSSKKVRNIMRAYLNWYDHKTLEILRLISVCDREISLNEIKELIDFDPDNIFCSELEVFNENDWAYTLSILEKSKLISISRYREEVGIDCHPIVRDFLNEDLKSSSLPLWIALNRLLFSFLVRSSNDPVTFIDLEPMCRAVVHGTRAGDYDEAYRVYFEKIKRRQFSVSTEFSHQLDHTCLRSFFDRKWDKPVECLEEEAKIYLLTSASTNLIYLGRIAEALGPSYSSIQWFLKNKKWDEAAAAAGPLVSMLIAAGELERAQAVVDQILPIVERADNKLVYAMALNFKGYVSYLQGNRKEAGRCFNISDQVITQPTPPCDKPLPTISAYYVRYLLDIGKGEAALDRALQTFIWREENSWQTQIDTTSLLGSDTLTLGIAYLNLGDNENASKYLNEQIEIFRSSEEWLYLPTGLNYRARFYIETGQLTLARQDLDESIEISIRTGAKFGEWEAYLEYARLFISSGEISEGSKYLRKALNLPKMDQYKFRSNEIEELQSQIVN